jgi:hypothetical protein
VGSGLSGNESEHLVNKLKPYFRQNEKNSKPPSFYVVTNSAKERPDVWIDQPDKSVVLQITSDIRTIRSEVSALILLFPCSLEHQQHENGLTALSCCLRACNAGVCSTI